MTTLRSSSQASKITPTDKDVLTTEKVAIDRRRFDNHPGNQRFNTVVDSKKEIYQDLKTTKKTKTTLIESIIGWMHKKGGRFLIVDDSTGEWSELSPRQRTDKISHALRRRKKFQNRTVAITVTKEKRKPKKPRNDVDVQKKRSSVDWFRPVEDPSSPVSSSGIGDTIRSTMGLLALSDQQQRSPALKLKGTNISEFSFMFSSLPPLLTLRDVLPEHTSMITNGYSSNKNSHSKIPRTYCNRHSLQASTRNPATEHELDVGWAEEVLDILSRTP